MAKPKHHLFKLTSPEQEGPQIRHLQQLLLKRGWLQGHVDGAFGVLTAQSVHRAKFWLGYLRPNQVAGDSLIAYLDRNKQPTAVMRMMASKRKAAAARKAKSVKGTRLTLQQHKVQHALSQLGQTERPWGSNRSKYSVWYGLIGAWCAMFQTWVSVTLHIEKKTWAKGQRYAYVPYVVADAIAGRNGLMVAGGPADGVRVCFDWQGDKIADHIGMAASEETLKLLVPGELAQAKKQFGSLSAGDFWCVEGNTGVGNDSNGGEVMLRKRNRANVRLFVKVAL